MRAFVLLVSIFMSSACTPIHPTTDRNPVADDVLFLVLGKMSLYDQDVTGDIALRNHHFVAEIMPKSGRKIVSGTLTSAADAAMEIEFQPRAMRSWPMAPGLRTPANSTNYILTANTSFLT